MRSAPFNIYTLGATVSGTPTGKHTRGQAQLRGASGAYMEGDGSMPVEDAHPLPYKSCVNVPDLQDTLATFDDSERQAP